MKRWVIVKQVEESYLPGIGVKYTLRHVSGSTSVVVVHNDGTRELYHLPPGSTESFMPVSMNDVEARHLAEILGGSYFKPDSLKVLEGALADLHLDWVKVTRNSSLAGKSIGDTRFRTRTGATIIAILRGEESIPNPGRKAVMEGGDTVVLMGTEKQLARAIEEIQP